MEAPIIEKTNNYDQFKILTFNRDIRPKHVDFIKSLIKDENLLHLHPILVNEKMEIIDGQHRFIAAREMGLPIYFIRSDVSYDQVLKSNMYGKVVNTDDIIKFYANKDLLSDYKRILDLQKELGIKANGLIALTFGSGGSGHTSKLLKSGEIELPDNEDTKNIYRMYKKFKDFVTIRKVTPLAMFNTPAFTGAFNKLTTLQNFREDILMRKLENCWYMLKPAHSKYGWLELLIEMYNYKNSVYRIKMPKIKPEKT